MITTLNTLLACAKLWITVIPSHLSGFVNVAISVAQVGGLICAGVLPQAFTTKSERLKEVLKSTIRRLVDEHCCIGIARNDDVQGFALAERICIGHLLSFRDAVRLEHDLDIWGRHGRAIMRQIWNGAMGATQRARTTLTVSMLPPLDKG